MRSRVERSAAALLACLALALTVSTSAPAAAAEQIAPGIAQNHTMIRLGLATVTAGEAGGSAFFVGREGYLVTSQQAVGQAASVTVRLPTGREQRGAVIRRDPALGVALIRIEGSGGEALPIRLQTPRVGARLFAVGAPFEETPVTAGRVMGQGGASGREILRSDVKILPAGSGGPVLDEFGNIVAIAKSGKSAGRSDLVPIMAALKALGLENGKLTAQPPAAPPASGNQPAASLTQAALRDPLPDSKSKAPAAAGGERAAWDAIRRSRRQADYAAFLGAYPEGEFAELARKRAAVPENRLWDAAFAEPLPATEAQPILDYFENSENAAMRKLTDYNRRNNIAASIDGDTHKVLQIDDVEVLAADETGATVKLIIAVGRWWRTPNTVIYKLQWIEGDLEPVRHQKL